MKIVLDRITYAALHDAFDGAPTGYPVNKNNMSVDLDDDEIEALESEAREGETLSQTILRVSSEVARATKPQQEAA